MTIVYGLRTSPPVARSYVRTTHLNQTVLDMPPVHTG